LLNLKNGIEVSVCIYTANYLYASGAEWITKAQCGRCGRALYYIQPMGMRRIEVKMQCLIDMVCKCERASRQVKLYVMVGTGESLITMWSAHNLHPRIPYGVHRHCHDVYEAHAATLWGIHTYASAVHIDCMWYQHFQPVALRMRSYAHDRKGRRSQVYAARSFLSTATSTRPVLPLGWGLASAARAMTMR